MNIHHSPNFHTEKVVEEYTKRDGVPVRYVCTTDLTASDVPVDVFYRDEPHPKFGNRYFGLYYDTVREHVMICDADIVESYEFAMVVGPDGRYYYSQSHHDYKMFDNGVSIDGGRQYARGNGYTMFKIKDGEFIKDFGEDLVNMVGNYVYPGSDCQQ